MAFPLLSSGNYGCPKEQAFRIAVDTITQYVMEHDLTVYLVLYDRHSLAVSETVSRMREAPCCASIGAEWKEQIKADFQKRHQE